MKKNQYKTISAGIIGNIIEYYNVTLYGFLTFHLTPLFFPKTTPEITTLISLGTFAVGFLARPFGAIIIGAIGDMRGRKAALLISISAASLPSFIMAFLPTFKTIGILSAFILLMARLVQGISVGGEYGNAIALIMDNTDLRKRNFAGSLLCASGFLGGIIAALMAALFTLDILPASYWRLAFALGGIFGIFGYFLRKRIIHDLHLEEGPPQSLAIPLKTIFTSEKIALLRSIAIGIASSAPFYICSIYANSIYTSTLSVEVTHLMFINIALLSLWCGLLPLFGRLCDIFSGPLIMGVSCCLIGLTGIVSPLFLVDTNFLLLVLFQLLLTISAVGFLAGTNLYLKGLFSDDSSGSGISLGYTIGAGIMGGSAPFIIEMTSKFTLHPASYYLILVSIIGLMSLYGRKSSIL